MAVLVPAAPALAAMYVCHPDPAGTANGAMLAFNLPGRIADVLGTYRTSSLDGLAHVYALAATGR